MKYIALILSIYTLYLVTTPCVDEPLNMNNPVAAQATPGCPGNHSAHADACSPFCICACCSVAVTIAPVMMIDKPSALYREFMVNETATFLSSFFVTFWQPPKIS
jgi:hypothetical protein